MLIIKILVLCLCTSMKRRPDKPLDNAQSNQLNRRLAQLATLGVFKSCKYVVLLRKEG
jgi:hypothetical protein